MNIFIIHNFNDDKTDAHTHTNNQGKCECLFRNVCVYVCVHVAGNVSVINKINFNFYVF